jgi:hypothetical protein
MARRYAGLLVVFVASLLIEIVLAVDLYESAWVIAILLLSTSLATLKSIVLIARSRHDWRRSSGESEGLSGRISARAIMFVEFGVRFPMSDQELDESLAFDESRPLQLASLLLAYLELSEANRWNEAASAIGKAVGIAHELRRQAKMPERRLVSCTLEHAAFAVAFLAGDVDYAARLLALADSSDVDSSTRLLALSAIYARQGDRVLANSALAKARSDVGFWIRTRGPDQRLHAVALLEVLLGSDDTRRLPSEEIESGYFAGGERSVFCFPSRDLGRIRALHYGSTLFMYFAAASGVVLLDSGLAWPRPLFIALAFCLFKFFEEVSEQSRARVWNSMIELSAEGVLHRFTTARRWITWDNVKRFGLPKWRIMARPGLVIPSHSLRRAGAQRGEPAFFQTSNYGCCWPEGDANTWVKQFAPALFSQAADAES